MKFKIIKQSQKSNLRLGELETAHGKVQTPAFMPCATVGSVKGVSVEELKDLGYGLILANTYHLHFQPGDKLIGKFGGLHKFMSWRKPIFTDSGGFQAFSLGLGALHGTKKIGFIPQNKEVKEEKKEVNTHTRKKRASHDREILQGLLSEINMPDFERQYGPQGLDTFACFDDFTDYVLNGSAKDPRPNPSGWTDFPKAFHNKCKWALDHHRFVIKTNHPYELTREEILEQRRRAREAHSQHIEG